MDTRKLRERFERVASEKTGSIHPTIDKVRKKRPRGDSHPKYDFLWYMKKEPKKCNPIAEVVGQEFFRLFLPAQPKTRLVVQKDIYGKRDQHFVISKEIPGYRSLYALELQDAEKLKENISTGVYKGLGQVLVAALFLKEDDLHLGNIGVDGNGNVVKIDGGFIFESERVTTRGDIVALPRLTGKYPKNWIGIYRWCEKLDKNEFVKNAFFDDERISVNPLFRREVNQMLLKICLLPEVVIKKMLLSYGEGVDAEAIFALLLQSQSEIREAAVVNADFINYLDSAASGEDMAAYFTYLTSFKTMGKHHVLNEERQDAGLIADMASRLSAMQNEVRQKTQRSTLCSMFARFFGYTEDVPVACQSSSAQKFNP